MGSAGAMWSAEGTLRIPHLLHSVCASRRNERGMKSSVEMSRKQFSISSLHGKQMERWFDHAIQLTISVNVCSRVYLACSAFRWRERSNPRKLLKRGRKPPHLAWRRSLPTCKKQPALSLQCWRERVLGVAHWTPPRRDGAQWDRAAAVDRQRFCTFSGDAGKGEAGLTRRCQADSPMSS